VARNVSHQQAYHERDRDGPQRDTTWGLRLFVERAQRKRVDVVEAFICHGFAAET
jgi:hypothetical protein